jgi:hypothetical protein
MWAGIFWQKVIYTSRKYAALIVRFEEKAVRKQQVLPKRPCASTRSNVTIPYITVLVIFTRMHTISRGLCFQMRLRNLPKETEKMRECSDLLNARET